MVVVGSKILQSESATNLLQLVKQSLERQEYYEPRKFYKYPSKLSSFLNDWLSQPHFGQSVKMRLTLPEVGTWSPQGLP